jgi:hypothetical protein
VKNQYIPQRGHAGHGQILHHHDLPGTPLQRRPALIFALRMLGLFLVLPVFMLEARKYLAVTIRP